MAGIGPGRYFREGVSLARLFELFPDNATAEAWFVERRWPEGVRCPHCDCGDVQDGAAHRSQRFRCRGCGQRFSARTGSLLAASNVGFRKWVIAIYLMVTNLKGVSSVKLSRDLGVSQKTAWFMAQRIREALEDRTDEPFLGPVESDEVYIGGKAKNMHKKRREEAITGRGATGKTAVWGVKDRATNQVRARPVPAVDSKTLTSEIAAVAAPEATVYTDGAKAYEPLSERGYEHESVAHSTGEYVRGQAHTNGIESFWAMLKRGLIGTYHNISKTHLHRYVNEFSGRANMRMMDTLDQMALVTTNMIGKRLRYRDLIA